MMLLGSKLQDKDEEKGFNSIAFETEMSQDHHIQDRQFSPWIRKATKKNQDHKQTQGQELKFLSKINLKHKKPQSPQNPEKQEVSTLRKNLQRKIKAEKLHNDEYIKLMKINRKVLQQKSYFQKRTKFGHLNQKPKYVELSLDWDIGKAIRGSPYLHSPSPQNKKKNIFVRTSKKKKDSQGERQFGETMKDFQRNIGTAHLKFYKTLELHVYPINERKAQIKESKEERVRFSSLNNRIKYNLPSKKQDVEESLMACEGKNLLSAAQNRSRRQKLKKQFQEKDMKEVIFLK